MNPLIPIAGFLIGYGGIMGYQVIDSTYKGEMPGPKYFGYFIGAMTLLSAGTIYALGRTDKVFNSETFEAPKTMTKSQAKKKFLSLALPYWIKELTELKKGFMDEKKDYEKENGKSEYYEQYDYDIEDVDTYLKMAKSGRLRACTDGDTVVREMIPDGFYYLINYERNDYDTWESTAYEFQGPKSIQKQLKALLPIIEGKVTPKPKTAKKTTTKPKAKTSAKKSKAKAKTGRKAPTISATKRKVGTRMRGNDGNMWQVNKSGKSQRWMAGAETMMPENQCIICGGPYSGYGHNPEPIFPMSKGRCCDTCNSTVVIPYRIAGMREEFEATSAHQTRYNINRFNKKPSNSPIGKASTGVKRNVWKNFFRKDAEEMSEIKVGDVVGDETYTHPSQDLIDAFERIREFKNKAPFNAENMEVFEAPQTMTKLHTGKWFDAEGINKKGINWIDTEESDYDWNEEEAAIDALLSSKGYSKMGGGQFDTNRKYAWVIYRFRRYLQDLAEKIKGYRGVVEDREYLKYMHSTQFVFSPWKNTAKNKVALVWQFYDDEGLVSEPYYKYFSLTTPPEWYDTKFELHIGEDYRYDSCPICDYKNPMKSISDARKLAAHIYSHGPMMNATPFEDFSIEVPQPSWSDEESLEVEWGNPIDARIEIIESQLPYLYGFDVAEEWSPTKAQMDRYRKKTKTIKDGLRAAGFKPKR